MNSGGGGGVNSGAWSEANSGGGGGAKFEHWWGGIKQLVQRHDGRGVRRSGFECAVCVTAGHADLYFTACRSSDHCVQCLVSRVICCDAADGLPCGLAGDGQVWVSVAADASNLRVSATGITSRKGRSGGVAGDVVVRCDGQTFCRIILSVTFRVESKHASGFFAGGGAHDPDHVGLGEGSLGCEFFFGDREGVICCGAFQNVADGEHHGSLWFEYGHHVVAIAIVQEPADPILVDARHAAEQSDRRDASRRLAFGGMPHQKDL